MTSAVVYNFLSYKKVTPIGFDIGEGPDQWIKTLRDTSTESLWHSYLYYCYELTAQYELTYLSNEAIWRQADRVLDIGYGPGFPVGHRKRYFPEKHYDLVALQLDELRGTSHRSKSAMSFVAKDPLFQAGKRSKYDVIFLRNISQHSEIYHRFLKGISAHLTREGRLILFESGDSLREHSPRLQTMEKMMKSPKGRDQFGDDGQRGHNFGRNFGHDFKVHQEESKTVTLVSDLERLLTFQSYLVLAEFMMRRFGIGFDEQKLCEELRRWALSPFSYCRYKIGFLVISPNHEGVNNGN